MHAAPPSLPPALLDVAVAASPMPIAELGGLKVLVDTGATAHAVRKAGGPPRAKVRDAHGAPMGAERLETPPIAGVAGPWFGVEGLPVAAVISPRAMLSPGQAAELDMRSRRFLIHDDPRTAAALIARSTSPVATTSCANGALYVAPAKLGGNPVRLLVDSGSARTTLLLKSPTARAFRKWSNYPATIPDPSGKHAAWVVLAVPVSIAGLEINVDLVVTDDPDEPCDVDGALGMDILRHCDFVLMRSVAGLTCE